MWYDNLPGGQLTNWTESFITSPNPTAALPKMIIMEQYALMVLQGNNHARVSFNSAAIEREAIRIYNEEIAATAQNRTVGIFLEGLLNQAQDNTTIVIDLFNFITSTHSADDVLSKVIGDGSEAVFYAMLESTIGHCLSLGIELPEFVRRAFSEWTAAQAVATQQTAAPQLSQDQQQALAMLMATAMQNLRATQAQQPPVVEAPPRPPIQAVADTLLPPAPANAIQEEAKRGRKIEIISNIMNNIVASYEEPLQEMLRDIVAELKTAYIFANDQRLVPLVATCIRELSVFTRTNTGAETRIIATGSNRIIKDFLHQVIGALKPELVALFADAEATPMQTATAVAAPVVQQRETRLFGILGLLQPPATAVRRTPPAVAATRAAANDFSLEAVVANPEGIVERANANPAAAAAALRGIVARIQQPARAGVAQAAPFNITVLLGIFAVHGLDAAINSARNSILEEQQLQGGVSLNEMNLSRFAAVAPHLIKAAEKLERKAGVSATARAQVVAPQVVPMSGTGNQLGGNTVGAPITVLHDAQQQQANANAELARAREAREARRLEREAAARAGQQPGSRPNPNGNMS